MIVIQRRNDHTGTFFGGHPSLYGHGFRGPRHFRGPHCFGGYGSHPMMAPHPLPSPSFYSTPFDQVEEAMMSPYHPRLRPRPHPFFLRRHRYSGPDMLGPVVLLARREDQSDAEKESQNVSENEKRQAGAASEENKAEESPRPEPSDKASEQSAENNEAPKETPTREENKQQEDEKAEEDMRRALMHIFGPGVRRSLRGGCRSRPMRAHANGGCESSSSIADMSVERTDEAVTIKVKANGYDPSGLSVEYAEGFLSISGERVDEDSGFHSKFVRRVPLNDRRMEVDNVSARLIDGVLNISVPRRSGATSRSIEIVSENKKSAESSPVESQSHVALEDNGPTLPSNDVDVSSGDVDSVNDAVIVASAETEKKETQTDKVVPSEDQANEGAAPESTAQDQNENESVSNVSLKDTVSVKTISSDDEDDDGEETFEMVG